MLHFTDNKKLMDDIYICIHYLCIYIYIIKMNENNCTASEHKCLCDDIIKNHICNANEHKCICQFDMHMCMAINHLCICNLEGICFANEHLCSCNDKYSCNECRADNGNHKCICVLCSQIAKCRSLQHICSCDLSTQFCLAINVHKLN
jgi:hypothetical protein